MGRPRVDGTRTFEGLKGCPPEALDYIHAAFRQKRLGVGPTWAELLKEIKAQFGLGWNDSSLSRYYAYWSSTLRIEDQARDEAEAIVSRLLQGGDKNPDLVAATKQLLQQQRLLALTRMDDADPTAVIALGQRQDQIDLAKDKLALDREKKHVSDEKLKLDQDRLQLEREKQAAIDRPSLFLEFWKQIIETIAGSSPEGAAVLNQHFDQVMAKIKAGAV